MGDLSRWKAAAVLALTLGICLAAVPNFLPARAFESLPTWAQRKIALSYDLQGGIRTVAVVDRNALRKEQLERLREDARRVLRDARVVLQGTPVIRGDSVEVRVKSEGFAVAREKLRELAGPVVERAPSAKGRSVKLAEVPPGVTSVKANRAVSARPRSPDFTIATTGDGLIIMTPTDAVLEERVAQARWQAIEITKQRLHFMGARTLSVKPLGDDRIEIEAIGVDNTWRFIFS